MWHYLASIFRDIFGCTVRIQGKWPSRQTDNHSNYCKFASQKFWSAEELLTLPVGTKPWTSHYPLPGGDRHRKEALDDLPSKDGTRSSSTRSTLELLQRQHSKFLINGTERIWAFSNVYTSNWTGLLFWNSQNISFCQKHIFYTSCVLPEKAVSQPVLVISGHQKKGKQSLTDSSTFYSWQHQNLSKIHSAKLYNASSQAQGLDHIYQHS